ncbi:MAG: thioredoxin [Oscillibacter sp.]|nr:thioredoxin [Oscillibacter sp.]
MRKIFFFVVLLCQGMMGFTQEGVNFEHLSFKEALDKARMENKLVFVDCYTSWCGPCRNMTEHIFPQKKVGDYFNSKFVCVKYDMEKGEGPELGKRFEVRAYPTFLVLRANGTLIHKLVGGRDANGIIQSVEEAFDASKAFGALEASYQEGRRDKDFLLNYLKCLIRFYDLRMSVVAGELMERLSGKERISEKYWFLFTNSQLSPAGSAIERYLLKNHTCFYKSIGKERVSREVEKRYAERFMRIFKEEEVITEQELKVLGREIASLKLANNGDLQSYVRIVRGKLKGTATLVDICEDEFLNIKALEVPYIQFCDRVMKEGTPEDGKRWIALGEKLYDVTKDEQVKRIIKFCLDFYKK